MDKSIFTILNVEAVSPGQKMAGLVDKSPQRCLPCVWVLWVRACLPYYLCDKSEGGRCRCVRKMSSSHTRCLRVGSSRFPSCVSHGLCVYVCVCVCVWVRSTIKRKHTHVYLLKSTRKSLFLERCEWLQVSCALPSITKNQVRVRQICSSRFMLGVKAGSNLRVAKLNRGQRCSCQKAKNFEEPHHPTMRFSHVYIF